MIAYFDTSALIPLIIDEPSTDRCARLWDGADRVVSARLLYPEARAALARAERTRRISPRQHAAAIAELENLSGQIDHIELTARLARVAGDLAQVHGLRGYDAVHLAAAASALDGQLVVVTGDVELAKAARSMGMAVADTN